MEFLETLDRLGICYSRHDHPAVFTCEQAAQLVPDLPGADTKNLFLRDKKGKRHFLVVTSTGKAVDIQQLADDLSLGKLSFGSAERLHRHLGIDPGSVSILALVNDADCRVELLIDRAVWQADAIQAHPLVNTSTLVIPHNDLERFLEHTGHNPLVVDVPAK